jgi:hypothetical protein
MGSAASKAVQLRAHHHHHQQQQQLQQEQQWLLEQLQQLGLHEAEGSAGAAGGVQGWLQGEGLGAVPEMVLRFLQDDAEAAADEAL